MQRLRWVLVAGAALLVLVLAAFVGYGRYRAIEAYRNILKHSGATITRDTHGVTWSQSVGGRTVFTVHAAKAVQRGPGQWSLHDAQLTLYGATPGHEDRISGAEFEYDQNQGVARAIGPVDIELSAPEGLAAGKGTASSSPAGGSVMHVRTSGLVYLRQLGVAATDQPVAMQYGGLTGTARGADFNSETGVIHLLREVRAQGVVHGRAMQLLAASAELDRTPEVVTLAQPQVTSGERSAQAGSAVLHLRKDGTVADAVAEGEVLLLTVSRTVRAGRLDAAFGPGNVAETARLTGGVTLVDSVGTRSTHGKAREMLVRFNAKGQPQQMVSTGSVVLESEASGAAPKGGAGASRRLQGEKVTAWFLPDERKPGAMRLSRVDAEGGASAAGESVTAGRGRRRTVISGDVLQLVLASPIAAGKLQPHQLIGRGHTRLQQLDEDGAEAESEGAALEVEFASSGGEPEVRSAVQSGGVTFRNHSVRKSDGLPAASAAGLAKSGGKPDLGWSRGGADKALFDAPADVLTLIGGGAEKATLEDDRESVAANRLAVMRTSGDATATGAVEATLAGSPGQAAVHAQAASAVLRKSQARTELRGTDVAPARLWQGASQVEAATLIMEGKPNATGEGHTLTARPASPGGLVHAVFAAAEKGGAGSVNADVRTAAGGTSPAEPGGPKGQSGNSARSSTSRAGRDGGKAGNRAVRVDAGKMDYSDVLREAVFAGDVSMTTAAGRASSDRATVFLNAVPRGGAPGGAGAGGLLGGPAFSLDRVVLTGGVRLQQPGRQGRGEQLLYTAAGEQFVLTGTPEVPPVVVDAQKGTVTGATLLFGGADSSIVVAGAQRSGSSEGKPAAKAAGRVHTQVEVREQEHP